MSPPIHYWEKKYKPSNAAVTLLPPGKGAATCTRERNPVPITCLELGPLTCPAQQHPSQKKEWESLRSHWSRVPVYACQALSTGLPFKFWKWKHAFKPLLLLPVLRHWMVHRARLACGLIKPFTRRRIWLTLTACWFLYFFLYPFLKAHYQTIKPAFWHSVWYCVTPSSPQAQVYQSHPFACLHGPNYSPEHRVSSREKAPAEWTPLAQAQPAAPSAAKGPCRKEQCCSQTAQLHVRVLWAHGKGHRLGTDDHKKNTVPWTVPCFEESILEATVVHRGDTDGDMNTCSEQCSEVLPIKGNN